MKLSNVVAGLAIVASLTGLVQAVSYIQAESVEYQQAAECVQNHVRKGIPRNQIVMTGPTCEVKNRATLFDSNTD